MADKRSLEEGATSHKSCLRKVPEAANRLNVSIRSVWRLIAEKQIEVVRVGRTVRIDEREIEKFIAQGGER